MTPTSKMTSTGDKEAELNSFEERPELNGGDASTRTAGEGMSESPDLHSYMRDVARANGFDSLTDSITRALRAEGQLRYLADCLRQRADGEWVISLDAAEAASLLSWGQA